MSSNLEKAKLHITLAQRQGVGENQQNAKGDPNNMSRVQPIAREKSHKKWVTQMERVINMTIT
jgi:hypothetical protein